MLNSRCLGSKKQDFSVVKETYDEVAEHIPGLLANFDLMLLVLTIPYVLLFLLDDKVMLFTFDLRFSKSFFESLIILDLLLLVFDHFCLLVVAQLSPSDFAYRLIFQSLSVQVAFIVLFYRLKN